MGLSTSRPRESAGREAPRELKSNDEHHSSKGARLHFIFTIPLAVFCILLLSPFRSFISFRPIIHPFSLVKALVQQRWHFSSDPHTFLQRQKHACRHVLSNCTLDMHSVQAPSTMHRHLVNPIRQTFKAMHQSQSDPSRSLRPSSNSWTRLSASTMLENWLQPSSTRPRLLPLQRHTRIFVL
jgi:hypothetical protein